MLQLERNSLVWPTPEGWATLHAQALPDPVAQAVVQHWHAQRLPLVVGRQAGVPSQDGVALGLPAPAKWDRRRLAFALPVNQLAYSGRFPPAVGCHLAATLAAPGSGPGLCPGRAVGPRRGRGAGLRLFWLAMPDRPALPA